MDIPIKAALRAFGLVAALFLASPVRADDDAAAKAAYDPIAVLSSTIADAKAASANRYAFTVDYWTRIKSRDPSVATARFDPRRPAGERWMLLQPSPEEASDDVRDALKKMNSADARDEDGMAGDATLLYDGLDELVGQAEVQTTTPTQIVLRAPIRDKDLPDDALIAEVTLNRAGGFVEEIAVRSVRAFKPNPMVKLKAVEQIQVFAPEPGGGPVFLRESRNATEGSAAFQSFDSETRIAYRDFEQVTIEAPATPE